MRRLFCGVFFVGLALGMGGYAMSAINLTISLCSLAYFPLVLICLKRTLERGTFALKVWTAAALLLQYLAGDPSISFVTFLVCGLFTLYQSVEQSASRKRAVIGPLISFFQIAGLFCLFGAFQLLMFAEFLFHSMRMKMSFYEAMRWGMQLNDLAGVVIPFFSDLSMVVMDYWARQSWLENYYCGVTILVLAVAAFGARRHERIVGYHVLLALWGLALSLGQSSAVYPFLHRVVPLLSFIRYPIRFFFLFSFALACLAGFGLDFLLNGAETFTGLKSKKWRVAGILAVIFAGLTLGYAFGFDPLQQKISNVAVARFGSLVKRFYSMRILRDNVFVVLFNFRRSLLLGSWMLVCMWLFFHPKVRKSVALAFVACLVTVDLSANAIEPRIDKGLIEAPSSNLTKIIHDRDLFRVFPSAKALVTNRGGTLQEILDNNKDKLTSNLMMLYGIYDSLGYDSIYLRDTSAVQNQLVTIKSPDKSRLMDLLNVKYVVTPKEFIGDRFELVHVSKPFYLFRNKGVLPRAFLVPKAVAVPKREDILKKISADNFDPTSEIYLESAPGPGSAAASPSASKNPVRIAEYSSGKVRMTVQAAQDAWLFFSDTYYPGWRAWVDGKPAKIYRADYAFRALPLAAGSHEVIWKYDPVFFKWGLLISLVSVIGVVCIFRRVDLE